MRSRRIKNEKDKTRTDKIVLNEREIEVYEQFDKLIRIKYDKKYNREQLKNDYIKYYKEMNNIHAPPMTIGKISDLKTGKKKISLRNNYIGFVENWLNARLDGA